MCTGTTRGLALFSISQTCINKGNLIIEHAARKALGTRRFAIELNAHARLNDGHVEEINRCSGLVLPGATLLQPGDHEGIEALPKITVPILALGVSLRSYDFSANLEIARQIRTQIGCRDPFTYEALRWARIPARLVGCPVLLLGNAERWAGRPGPIVFSIGLGPQEMLEECALACANIGQTVLLLHAPDRQPARIVAPNLSPQPLDDAVCALNLIRSASVVVTSRIHALLPAIAFGVPAIFLGGFYDSRYSLVEFLGVPIEPPVPLRIQRMVSLAREGKFPHPVCLERAQELRESQLKWLEDVGGPLGVESQRSLLKQEWSIA